MKKMVNQGSLKRCRVKDNFWTPIQELISDTVIPYQEKILNDKVSGAEKSHAIENFRIAAGDSQGEFYGTVFQDSDVAKWLEAVAYSLERKPDEKLEARADAVIDLIEKAQQPDGYLNTYFTIKEPEHRWQNLQECHELYCAGHMMEAAVAYYQATGKDKLLKVMCRMADHIDARFGEGKQEGIPGHEEIELALLRLYRATGEKRYLDLSAYFINQRGKNPHFFEEESAKRGWTHFGMDPKDTEYNQSYAPVRDQREAVGHSVRAMYLYTAMADLAAETGDKSLYTACRVLFESATHRRMYVTGGIGSSAHGEAFTQDYDLPNDTAYAETCAAIGLVFFARKMLSLEVKGEYADVMERCLYNGILSGMQKDGSRFFYVNPLEVIPGLSGKWPEYKHALPARPKWYACACCPPNLARLVESLGEYAWGENDTTIYSHLYLGGSYTSADGTVVKSQSSYPWKGKVSYEVKPGTSFTTLAIHIPGWCKEFTITVNEDEIALPVKDGYCYLTRDWKDGDKVTLSFSVKPRRVYADPRVREDAGKVCLMRGPLVYCLEAVDNGKNLCRLLLPRSVSIVTAHEKDEDIGSYVSLRFTGLKEKNFKQLYQDQPPETEPVPVKAIPYFLWGNRKQGEMRVWINEG